MTSFIETLNHRGDQFLNFAWPMLWQSSLLIAIVFVLEFALRRKIRAAIRYALWLMVLVKLLLPPSLALPTSLAWWLLPAPQSPAKPQTTAFVVTYGEQTAPAFPLQLQPAPAPLQPKMSFAAKTLTASGAVSAGLLAWLLVRWWQISRKVRRAKTSEELIPLLDEARRLTRLRRGIRLKLTDDTMSPAVCGLFRPVILLPQSLVEKLSARQLRAVLLHEVIHLRRGDVWMNCAQALLQIFYWWHPLLWLANARIRRVREEAVDDGVMLALRDDAEIYAPTLLEVAKLAFNRPLASLGLVGILESRSALRQRIERLVNFHAPRKAGLTLVSILGILAFSAIAVPMGEAPEKTSDNPTVATNGIEGKMEAGNLAQDGKLLYEMGKFDEAETKLKAALALNPDNQAAQYYLDLVKKSRQAGAANVPGNVPMVNTNPVTGILSDTNFQARIHALEQRTGVETLAKPKPVVTVGRQANYVDANHIQQVEYTPAAESDASSTRLMTFLISPPINENDLKKLLLAAGVNTPPTTFIYMDGGILLVRGSEDQLNLVQRVVLKLNGFTPKADIGLAVPNSHVITNDIHTSPGREMIYRKLHSLRLESVSWSNGLPLSEAIRYLAEQSRLRDPDKKGINFMFNPNVAASTTASNAAPETVDPNTINVKLVMNDVSLHDALDAVMLAADHPIKYSIEDFAVVISPKPSGSEPPTLEERVFRVDKDFFSAALRNIPGLQTNNVATMAESLFSKLGVDFTAPGRSIAFNDRLGLLFVKATPSELDNIERVVQALNSVNPQIHIKAYFIEVPKKGFVMPSSFSNVDTTQTIGILNQTNFHTLLGILRRKNGGETLAEPEAVLNSGMQVQMRVTTIQEVITNYALQEIPGYPTSITAQRGKFEIGPTMDVVPYVLSDGYTINLTAIASVFEFLGYEPANNISVTNKAGQRISMPTARPGFRVQQAVAHLNLWDGQTAVLGKLKNMDGQTMALGNLKSIFVGFGEGNEATNESKFFKDLEKKQGTADKELLVFITATIVDPAGNRVHSDDKLPFNPSTIPPQPH
jgi:beta-lactamase regulating signal transducer with metallopeptidase domain/Flp pilus assembly secretin CpaC